MTLGSDALVSFELGGELYKRQKARRQPKKKQNVKSVRANVMYVPTVSAECYAKKHD